jgi:hypothetical protein
MLQVIVRQLLFISRQHLGIRSTLYRLGIKGCTNSADDWAMRLGGRWLAVCQDKKDIVSWGLENHTIPLTNSYLVYLPLTVRDTSSNSSRDVCLTSYNPMFALGTLNIPATLDLP